MLSLLAWLARQGRQEDGIPWGLLVWLAIFIVVPAAGRIIKWIAEKAGAGLPAAREAAAPPPGPPPDEGRVLREEFEELQEKGLDRWRELSAGGEATPADLEPAPVPARSTPRPAPAAAARPEISSPPISSLEPAELPSAAEGRPSRGSVPEPPSSAFPRIRHTLDDPRGDRPGSGPPGGHGVGERVSPPSPVRRRLPVAEHAEVGVDWRRAIVLSEILAPPVSLRPPREPGAGP